MTDTNEQNRWKSKAKRLVGRQVRILPNHPQEHNVGMVTGIKWVPFAYRYGLTVEIGSKTTIVYNLKHIELYED